MVHKKAEQLFLYAFSNNVVTKALDRLIYLITS